MRYKYDMVQHTVGESSPSLQSTNHTTISFSFLFSISHFFSFCCTDFHFLISNHVHHHQSRRRCAHSWSCSSPSSIPELPSILRPKCFQHLRRTSGRNFKPRLSFQGPFHCSHSHQALSKAPRPGTDSSHRRCLEEGGRLYL